MRQPDLQRQTEPSTPAPYLTVNNLSVQFPTEDGLVQSSLKPRCVACSNCVLACPFGVPKMFVEIEQMMKCDMCYDRTSAGKRPMCATVCPSQALAFVTPEEIARDRRERPVNTFQFGNQEVVTKVHVMMPTSRARLEVDVADHIWEAMP